MSFNGALVVCQSGFESLLAREMEGLGLKAGGSGPGWVLAPASDSAPSGDLRGAAFPHAILEAPSEAAGDGVNELARAIADRFAGSIRDERIEAPWPCLFSGSQEVVGLGRRVASVEAAFHGILKKKLGRVAKLAVQRHARVGPARGLFVWFTDFGRVQVARTAYMSGPLRMADDDASPSRSYLKVEAAYGILGAEPRPGESVCDLGPDPVGWSYSAAKRERASSRSTTAPSREEPSGTP